MDMEKTKQIFTEIYNKNLWNGGSGPGSNPENILTYITFLQKFLHSNNITSILDLGCGDWQYMKTT
jgi:hypothetical protein